MGDSNDQTPPERRLTVSDAALELGLSAEAVRSRIKRGTLHSVKEGSTVYVILPANKTRPNHTQTTTEHDRADTQTTDQTELVESLQDQVAYLREQLGEEREARRRADTIIAQLTQANATLARRVPELAAAPEMRGAPETTYEDEGRGDTPPDDTDEPRVSWWRRVFGG